ncbi:MAG: hypothetical protein U9Q15_01045 [Patescibacteria group bacterium]|nr:hypothetical protein [Patescibacteria group bacterium]
MAKRTVKRGAIRSKQLQAKGHSKSDRKWKFHKYRRLTFEQAREEGVIEARKFVKKDG